MDLQTLSTAMGNLSTADYERFVSPFNEALFAAECTTVNRVAMWCAQVGHESGGLRYMEEIADGSAYEGRLDLGNTQPGDGRRSRAVDPSSSPAGKTTGGSACGHTARASSRPMITS